MRKGKLIVLEGSEGSGKSSVVALLQDYFREKGKKAVLFREPGGTVAGEDIRSIILDRFYEETISGRTEAYLYAASRSELVEKRILPSLETYDYVLLDRYYYSSLVWQGEVRGLGRDFICALNKPFMEQAKPDLAIYLYISEQERLRRMAGRQEKQDRLDQEPLDLLRRVDDAYQRLAAEFPEFQTVNAECSIDKVMEACRILIEKI